MEILSIDPLNFYILKYIIKITFECTYIFHYLYYTVEFINIFCSSE